MEEKRPVRVTILNQQYTLVAGEDPREVEDLARSLDELLHSISEKAPSADATRVAVLGCLHLADRLRELERDLALLRERVGHKSKEFAGLLERALEG
jgi:cell division protein ZapA